MTKQDVLKYVLEDDMIDLSYIREQIRMKERKDLLDKHPYTIWQGNDGKWYTYFPDKTKKRIKRRRNTKKELEEEVLNFWKDKESNPTVRELFKEWIGLKNSHNIQNQTVDRYWRDFNRYLSKIAETKIAGIDECELDDFLVDMVFTNNMTAKAFSNVRILIRGIWNRAKKKKIIDYRVNDVLEELDISSKDFRKTEKKSQVYTDDERKAMVDYLGRNLDTINMGILLMFATGIRIGELAALKPSDIISSNRIRISKTEICYEKHRGEYVYEVRDFPKTEAGKRDVFIPDDFAFYLKVIQKQASRNEWLFEKYGQRIKTYQFRCRLNYICERKLHMPVKSPHKIRKTYASQLIDSHVPDSLIISQMGHTDIETTKKFYYDNRFDEKEADEILSKLKVI